MRFVTCVLLALPLCGGCYKSHVRDADSSSDAGVRQISPPEDGGALGVPDASALSVTDGGTYGAIKPICSPRLDFRPAWYVRVSDHSELCESIDPLLPPITGTRVELYFYDELSERDYALLPWPSGEASLTVRYGDRSWSDDATSGTVVIERLTPDGEMVLRWSATIEPDGQTIEGRARVTTICPGPSRWPDC